MKQWNMGDSNWQVGKLSREEGGSVTAAAGQVAGEKETYLLRVGCTYGNIRHKNFLTI